mgnify:CR=1 FL=1
MKKSIVIAIVGVLVVAGIGSAAYFQTTKKPSVGSAVVATEQEATVPSADDMEAQVKEVVAAREAELEAQKAAEEEAARVAVEQAAKEEAEKAAKEKEQVADSNTSTKGNTTAKSNKSGNTGTKSNSSTSSNGSSSASTSSNASSGEEDPEGFNEDNLPNLQPGDVLHFGEHTGEYVIPGGGTAYTYDPISDAELNEHLN